MQGHEISRICRKITYLTEVATKMVCVVLVVYVGRLVGR